MSRVRFMIAVSYFFVAVFAVLLVSPVLSYSQDEARATVEAAEGEVLSCYGAVSEAQKAGANVSDLLSVLNEASWFLSRAKLAYSQGDFDSAVIFADNCSSRLYGFLEQAESLRANAEQASYWDFMANFVGAGVGALCVVVGGFAVWVFLKRREETRGCVQA